MIRFDFIILCDESHRMLYDDFCKCTFGEFESICEAWREMTEGAEPRCMGTRPDDSSDNHTASFEKKELK